jgi:GntR family transcriptional regulator
MVLGKLVTVSPLPLYTQIKQRLRDRILDGSFGPHSQMPSESELMAAFEVSRITVRQALGDLQKEGLIFKIHGKGSYVSKPKAFQNLGRLQGFAEAMSPHGYETINQVLSFKRIKAARAITDPLGLPASAYCTEIKRLRFLNREPISVDISYLAAEIGAKLESADLVARDVFSILENDLGLALGAADVKIEAILADAELARLLRLEEGAPILRIERLTHTAAGEPLDFEYLFYRADAFQYRLRVERGDGEPAAKPRTRSQDQ